MFSTSLINKIFNDEVDCLCPIESIILYFMIQICRNGIYADFTINELYNVKLTKPTFHSDNSSKKFKIHTYNEKYWLLF